MSTEYKVFREPTCKVEGEKALYCLNNCGLKEDIQPIEKIPHSYTDDDWTEVKEATCTDDGEKTVNCKVCGTLIEGTITALGHDFSKNFKIDDPAGCKSVGSKSKHCSRCEAKDEVTEIPATGHNVTSWNTTAATCTTNGSKTGTCTNSKCSEPGNSVTEVILATGHNIPEGNYTDKNVEGNYQAPTCVADGWWKGTCTVCGLVNNPIPASGHEYGEWEVITPATCTADGQRKKTCKH
jgi:hypothetical protein